MKIITAGVTSAMLAVGIAGSVAAYRTQVAAPDARPVSQKTVEEVSTAADPVKPNVRWAPCPEGSSLEKGACVTDVVRTIVLPAPSPTALPSPQVAATPQGQAEVDESDDTDDADHADQDEADEAGDHDGDDDGDHDGDDHEDDGDDHDEDDGDDHEDDGDDHEDED